MAAKAIQCSVSVIAMLYACPSIAQVAATADTPAATTAAPVQTAIATPAPADPGTQHAQTGIDDIVVVARRRSEAAQTVPLSISAASGSQLQSLNITETKQLALIAPSLKFAPSIGGSTTVTASIRGQRDVEPRLGFDSSIGVYFAGVPIARPYGLNQGLYDLQSIQVLNGPQGTLFGRNTTGGAILFEPNAPVDKLEGSLDLEYGNYNNRIGTAVLNVPVTEGVAIRAAGRIARRDGYTLNLFDGRHYDDLHNESGRVSVSLKPIDGVSNLTVVDYFHNDSNGQMQILGSLFPCGPGGVGTSDCIYTAGGPFGDVEAALAAQRARGNYVADSNSPIYDREKILGISNTSEYRISDDLLFKNIFGYRDTKVAIGLDLDGTALSILGISGSVHAKQTSEEFQFQGSNSSKSLEFIVGGFLFRESGTDIYKAAALADLNPAGIASNGGYVLSKSEAIFAQGSYHVPGIEGLTITLGGRQTWDQRSVALISYDNFGCGIDRPADLSSPGTCPAKGSVSFNAFTWTAGTDYKIGSTLLYVASRHGYRSGGIDLTDLTTAQINRPFRPETITDAEVGIKRDWNLGGAMLRTNLSVYYGWAKDLQRSVRLNPDDAVPTSFNAASGRIYGAEFLGLLRLSSALSFNSTFVYNHASYNRYRDPAGDNYDNDRFAFDPRYRFTLGTTYSASLGTAGKLSANVNYQWSSSYYWDDVNNVGAETAAQGLLGASLQLDNIGGTGLGATVFVTNALDKRAFIGGNGNSIGLNVGVNEEPRFYGLRLSYRFGE